MTLADGKEPPTKIFVDVRLNPIGRYRVDVNGKMICGWAVMRLDTVYVNLPVLGLLWRGKLTVYVYLLVDVVFRLLARVSIVCKQTIIVVLE
jgi:hypothetical protein